MKSRFEVVVTSYGRKNRDDFASQKNIAGQVLTYNSKSFHWLQRKLDLEGTRTEFGKPFLKNQIKEKTENQCLNAASETKTTSEKCKFDSNKKLGLEWTMNGLGKPFTKTIRSKKLKKSKNQSEIAACEQKPTSEKANFFSNTVFSLYLKIRANFHAANPLAFSLHFLFRRKQNHYFNLTSKIMKMCEHILKHSRTSADVQFKEFSLTTEKTRPRTDYEWIGKTI